MLSTDPLQEITKPSQPIKNMTQGLNTAAFENLEPFNLKIICSNAPFKKITSSTQNKQQHAEILRNFTPQQLVCLQM